MYSLPLFQGAEYVLTSSTELDGKIVRFGRSANGETCWRNDAEYRPKKVSTKRDLIDAVEEISGGVRFGTINEFYLEAVFRDSEDSWAAATLARWLPGILQLEQPYSHRRP
jgi:hypothetical protein